MESSIIAQAYRNNWEVYQAVLEASVPGWDMVILTASNERQAAGYQMQLDRRLAQALIPSSTDFRVVPDVQGVRIGSGGATISALQVAKDEYGSLSGRRILVIHSGGDSKRLPQYASFGKLFSRVPHSLSDGRPSTLFDEFFVALCGLPSRMNDGVVAVSGDVLLVFDHAQLDLCRQGVVGVAMDVEAKVGSRHGVFVVDDSGRVLHFPQKASVDRLTGLGAVSDQDTVRVDTGLVWIDAESSEKLLATSVPGGAGLPGTAGVLDYLVSHRVGISLYSDVMVPLAQCSDREDYLADESEGPATCELRCVRQALWEQLRGIPLSVQALKPAQFMHWGSTSELRSIMAGASTQYGGLGWSQSISSHSSNSLPPDVCMANSALGPGLTVGSNCFVEDSWLDGVGSLSDGSVVSNVVEHRFNGCLRPNVVLDQTPVGVLPGPCSFVTRLYGVMDNPKLHYLHPSATYMNITWPVWLENSGVSPEDIWTGVLEVERSLWTARLFPMLKDRSSSLRAALWLQGGEGEESCDIWRASLRVSMAELSRIADRGAILATQDEVALEVAARRFEAGVEAGTNSWQLMAELSAGVDDSSFVPFLRERVSSWDRGLSRMRGYKCLCDFVEMNGIRHPDIRPRALKQELEDAAFGELRHIIGSDAARESGQFRLVHDVVTARAAARIDFGGGWSDTPPYSVENGGKVLNAAVTLNGALPVTVMVRRLVEPVLRLVSADQGVRREMTSLDEVMSYANPADPLALHKACLVLSGVVGSSALPLEEFLAERIGSGLELETSIPIPKGSGLGTSSIVAGAVLAALAKASGEELSEEDLFVRVLALEQVMTTGGGWQDQVGGLAPAIKLVTSNPGVPQRPKWSPLPLTGLVMDELNSRFVLVYTGQRRLAKRLLRNIMGSYISRDPRTVASLGQIQVLALEMRKALHAGDVSEFGRLLGQHWAVNKVLDPGCTNAFIDELFELVEPYTDGGKLAGAGGGGFLALVAHTPEDATRISVVVEEAYPDSNVRAWPTSITDRALEVVVG